MRKLILTAVLTLSAVVSVSATPSFTFAIPGPTVMAGPGGTALFGYQLTNTSTEFEDMLYMNLGFNVDFSGFGIETDLIDPLLLVAEGQTATGNLFQVLVNSGVAPQTYSGIATVTVGFSDLDFTVISQSQPFSIVVSDIPEPASLSLLAVGALFVATLARRGLTCRVR